MGAIREVGAARRGAKATAAASNAGRTRSSAASSGSEYASVIGATGWYRGSGTAPIATSHHSADAATATSARILRIQLPSTSATSKAASSANADPVMTVPTPSEVHGSRPRQ